MYRRQCLVSMLVQFHQKFAVRQVEVPTPGENDLLLRMGAAGFCHTEYSIRDNEVRSKHQAADVHLVIKCGRASTAVSYQLCPPMSPLARSSQWDQGRRREGAGRSDSALVSFYSSTPVIAVWVVKPPEMSAFVRTLDTQACIMMVAWQNTWSPMPTKQCFCLTACPSNKRRRSYALECVDQPPDLTCWLT
jgi:hypothetical protein